MAYLHATSSAYCSATYCTNRLSNRTQVSFFRFPKEPDRCQQWVQNAQRCDLQNKTPEYLQATCRLCAEHFEDKHFHNKKDKNRLNWNAVPTIFKLPNKVISLYNSRKPLKRKPQEVVYIVTDHTYSKVLEIEEDNDDSRRTLSSIAATEQNSRLLKKVRLQKIKLKKMAQQLKRETARRESPSISDLIKQASAFLEEPALTLFASQLQSSSQRSKAKGRRWTYNDKVIALDLYHQCPSTYKFFLRTFALPSVLSLRKWLSNVEVRPGFAPKVFELLRDKVGSMTERNKLCIVTFDLMSLRSGLSYNITEDVVEGFEDFGSLGITSKPADHALVFMVRGLIGKWKQPIGYFLSKDTKSAEKLKKLLKKCIQNLKDAGLQPKAVVCDQGSCNVRLYKLLSVTEEKPFFKHGKNKIFCLHDPPHLLMDTRSNLQQFVIQVNGEDDCKPIRWKHIQNFFEYDSGLAIRKAHKLTKGHFECSNFSKMTVNEAAQVLSHSVAAGIYTYAAFDKLPAEAAYTAEFVEMMNNLFDAFNSKGLKDPHKMRRPLSDDSEHKSFFESCLPILKNLKVVGGKHIEFIEGWCLAISCVSQLWQHLKETTDVQFLMTSHLNQDVVGNMFSTLRRKGGFANKPSAREFRFAFRMVMVDALIQPVAGSKSPPDSEKFIKTLSSLTSNEERLKQSQRVNNARKAIAVNNIPVDLPEQNTLAHIAGYLCNKVFTGHELFAPCQTCRKALLKGNGELDNPALLFIQHKAFDTFTSDLGSLMVPSERFLAFCAECEKVFCTEFEDKKMTRSNISNLLNQAMKDLDLYKKLHVCSERIKAKIVAVFVNVRIHYALKFKNMQIHDVTPKSKRRKLQTVGHK